LSQNSMLCYYFI